MVIEVERKEDNDITDGKIREVVVSVGITRSGRDREH